MNVIIRRYRIGGTTMYAIEIDGKLYGYTFDGRTGWKLHVAALELRAARGVTP